MNDDNDVTKTRRRGGKRDGLFQRNGWWWLDYYNAEGRRHREKAAPDYETAKKLYRDKMTAIAKGELLGVKEEGMYVKAFVARKYWPTVQSALSVHERRRLRGILDRQILPRFGGIRLCKLQEEDIEVWQADRLTNASPGTVRKEQMWLKHLLYRAVKWKYLKESPAKSIDALRTPPGRVRYLTPDEREALLKHARSDLRLYIQAALQTGARRGELKELKWKDVDMRARTVTFEKTKNGDRRVVPMTDTFRDLLTSLPRPIDQNASVLPALGLDAITIAFRRLVKTLGLTNLTFHSLRHDVGSTLAMAGVPQRTIMEILGHRDPRMSLRYQHLPPGHLRQAIHALDAPPTQHNSKEVASIT